MRKIVVIVALMILIQGCNSLDEKPYTIVIDGSLLEDKLSRSEKRKLEKYISQSIDTVSTRLGFEYQDTLTAFVFDTEANEGGGNRIYLEREASVGLVIHEVTHAITPPQASWFFSEGLAMLMPIMSLREDPRESYILRNFIPKKDKLIPIRFLMENDSIFVKHDDAQGTAYMEAGLFLCYLVDHYGWEKMRDLFDGRVKDLESMYGKPVEELEREWLETIFPTPPKDTLTIRLDQ